MKLLFSAVVGLVCHFVFLILPCAGQEAATDDGVIRPSVATEPVTSDLISISSLRAKAVHSLHQGDSMAAISAAGAIVGQYPEAPRAARVAGDLYLRAGDWKAAVKQFDRYLEMEPSEMPDLWQRGIALYFAGEYLEAAEQFEKHRKVNANDVENAAWHFLCIAKSKSPQKAREMALPAPNDPRVPMQEVLQMLSSGDTGAVRRAVRAVAANSPAAADAKFYGDFYLGLYADATGDQERGLELMSRAAENAPSHYMGDVARVYADHLRNTEP